MQSYSVEAEGVKSPQMTSELLAMNDSNDTEGEFGGMATVGTAGGDAAPTSSGSNPTMTGAKVVNELVPAPKLRQIRRIVSLARSRFASGYLHTGMNVKEFSLSFLGGGVRAKRVCEIIAPPTQNVLLSKLPKACMACIHPQSTRPWCPCSKGSSLSLWCTHT